VPSAESGRGGAVGVADGDFAVGGVRVAFEEAGAVGDAEDGAVDGLVVDADGAAAEGVDGGDVLVDVGAADLEGPGAGVGAGGAAGGELRAVPEQEGRARLILLGDAAAQAVVDVGDRAVVLRRGERVLVDVVGVRLVAGGASGMLTALSAVS